MSKSLKNYTSIQRAGTIRRVNSRKKIRNIYEVSRKRYLQEGSSRMLGDLKWEAKHHALNNAYLDCQLQSEDAWVSSSDFTHYQTVRSALEDDVDTPTAMRHLKNLIRDVNVFLRDVTDIRKQRNLWPLLTNITHYVQDSLEGWGVDCSDWVQSAKVDITTNSHEAPAFDQAIEVLLAVRSELRTLAIKHKKAKLKDDGALANELLGITDKIRDSLLPGMGVEVKDRQGQSGEMVHTWTFNPRLIASQQDEAKTDSK
eukprot:768712-Hanusia_phi.AAC.2